MKTIKAQKHILNFYLAIFTTILFCLAFLIAILIAINILATSGFEIMKLIALLACLLVFAVMIDMLIGYLKNAPVVSVTEQYISVGKEKYPLADILHIDLTGKFPFGYNGVIPKEGMLIEFSTGQKIYLFDSIYSNLWQIKQFLEQQVILRQAGEQLQNTTHLSDRSFIGDTRVFDQNQFISTIGIMAWGELAIFLLLSLVGNVHFILSMITAFTGILLLIFISSRMHYFKISDEGILIKCHNLFWIKQYYKLDDIKQIVFEKHRGSTRGIRIITNDFKTKLYYGATLKAKTWVEMKELLKSNGVTIRKEPIEFS